MKSTLRALAATLCLVVLPLTAQAQTVFRSSFEANEGVNITVDPTLTLVITEQPGIDGGPPRPLALMQSAIGDGYSFHFVENEIYLITDDPQDLTALQSRWPSTVLAESDLDVFDAGDTQDTLYILQVDPATADVGRLRENLQGLTTGLEGRHTVSSATALRLIALVASEIRDHGLRVGINPVLQTDGLLDRRIQEAALGDDITDASGPAGTQSYVYARNPFAWPQAKREDQFPSISNMVW